MVDLEQLDSTIILVECNKSKSTIFLLTDDESPKSKKSPGSRTSSFKRIRSTRSLQSWTRFRSKLGSKKVRSSRWTIAGFVSKRKNSLGESNQDLLDSLQSAVEAHWSSNLGCIVSNWGHVGALMSLLVVLNNGLSKHLLAPQERRYVESLITLYFLFVEFG